MPADNRVSKHADTVQKTDNHSKALIHMGWSKLYSPYPQALAQTLGATSGPLNRVFAANRKYFS
ncbi:hypothetical protein [Pseudomonas sp. H9]|uniref:hypothetical protein n=1 Tax=Pseudomonas sp. H9 TaxID=483968 RepID=UPI001057C720|nr:hypothetical protein [Pseudomonas sp. H9]TDF85200.1 hypothetical protein E1573_06040 [Pseudomonas sp. H9]